MSNVFSKSPFSFPAFPETSFLFAIHSAGLAYSFARQCAHGLERNCKCRKRRKEGKAGGKNRRMKSPDDSEIIIEDNPCINQNLRWVCLFHFLVMTVKIEAMCVFPGPVTLFSFVRTNKCRPRFGCS